ncbi:MAG TPA: hypothetical protein VL326_33050 [Kofleriaceae bacterium]|nr:hypothetical protein [Kofleriaceae bacterium]
MVNGPPCRACGWTLRWAPEQNAWMCDRCRSVFPAQGAPAPAPQMQPPQQPYGQPPQQPYGQPPFGQQPPPGYGPGHAMPPPARKGGSKLWIVGTVLVVIGGIVALALAQGGKGSGGKGSNDQAGSAMAGVATPVAGTAPSPTTDKPADKPAGKAGGYYTQMVAKMTGFKERMCACKDQACIDGVSKDMTDWSLAQANNTTADMSDYNDAMAKQLTDVMEAYTKCMTDAMTASFGGTAEATTPVPVTDTPAISGTPSAPALAVGDRVSAQWTNGSWYPGKISAVNADGTYNIAYDDGDKSKSLPASKVRKAKAGSSSSGSHASSSSAASDAPCPGPGITRRCSGKCVNLQEDDNNCGGCGNKCRDGYHCDGHLFCRDAEGNL